MEAGERGLEREREVSSGNGAISAVDSIAYSDLSPRLREGEEGLIRFGFVFRGEGMNCHVIDCMLGPLVNELQSAKLFLWPRMTVSHGP